MIAYRGEKVTIKKVKSFIRGKGKKIADDAGFIPLPIHQKIQVDLRSQLCGECLERGYCDICKCDTPDMFYDPYKEDSRFRWGAMMDSETFDQFYEQNKDDNDILKNYTNYYLQMNSSNTMSLEEAIAKGYVTINEDIKNLIEENKTHTDEEKRIDLIKSDDDTKKLKEDIDRMPEFHDMKIVNAVYDYGVIEHHSNGNGSLSFPNTYDKPIAIRSVNSSCGCTVASFTSGLVAPGDNFTIYFTYNTGILGKFNKSVSITFQDTKILSTNIKIRGRVEAKQK